MSHLILAPGKDRSVARRHPWIFAGAVARLEGRARPGDTVEVMAADGRALGRAAYSPHSQIRARMWSFDPAETIDDAFFKRRIAAALARRAALPALAGQPGLRLVHAESDGLPGVIADRYGDTVVLQLTGAGADKWRRALAGALERAGAAARIYERSDSEVRALEGLEPASGWLLGEGGSTAAFSEHGLAYEADLAAGHKTGFYLDQRDNRARVQSHAAGRRVLNCFCYSGAFSLAALAGGAREVISIDSSAPALAAARRHLAANPQLPAERAHWRQDDVFQALRALRAADERFDLIVLDPPKFAPSAAHARQAARAYRDINVQAFRLLAPGGLLFTFSCSGGVGPELFQRIVAQAAADAGRTARILYKLGAGADHPIGLAFPEGEYLKGLACATD